MTPHSTIDTIIISGKSMGFGITDRDIELFAIAFPPATLRQTEQLYKFDASHSIAVKLRHSQVGPARVSDIALSTAKTLAQASRSVTRITTLPQSAKEHSALLHVIDEANDVCGLYIMVFTDANDVRRHHARTAAIIQSATKPENLHSRN